MIKNKFDALPFDKRVAYIENDLRIFGTTDSYNVRWLLEKTKDRETLVTALLERHTQYNEIWDDKSCRHCLAEEVAADEPTLRHDDDCLIKRLQEERTWAAT